MEANNQTIATLHDLLAYDSRGLAIAEVQLARSLGEWISKAGSVLLKNVLQKYLGFVEEHVRKTEMFFDTQKVKYFPQANPVMHAFIEEIENKLNKCAEAEVKDACLLASIQAINHFKISMYGTAAACANSLGMEKEAAVFHEAEVNEKQIDDRLSQLAEHEINTRALARILLPETDQNGHTF